MYSLDLVRDRILDVQSYRQHCCWSIVLVLVFDASIAQKKKSEIKPKACLQIMANSITLPWIFSSLLDVDRATIYLVCFSSKRKKIERLEYDFRRHPFSSLLFHIFSKTLQFFVLALSPLTFRAVLLLSMVFLLLFFD